MRVNTEDSRRANRARSLQRANAGVLQKGDYVLLLANERITFSSRFDPLWIITRIRGSTLWLLQQQTCQIRKVHRSKVKLADADIAWDSIPPRPKRKQAPAKRAARHQWPIYSSDPVSVTTDPVHIPTNHNVRPTASDPLVPPLRLRRKCIVKDPRHTSLPAGCENTVTNDDRFRHPANPLAVIDRKRRAYVTRTKNVRDASFNRRRNLRYDLHNTSHCLDSGEPLKRHCTNAPSMVDQK